jgi:hypothetical protein
VQSYLPTIYTAAISSAICFIATLTLGFLVKNDSDENRQYGVNGGPGDVDNVQVQLADEKDPELRWNS